MNLSQWSMWKGLNTEQIWNCIKAWIKIKKLPSWESKWQLTLTTAVEIKGKQWLLGVTMRPVLSAGLGAIFYQQSHY